MILISYSERQSLLVAIRIFKAINLFKDKVQTLVL